MGILLSFLFPPQFMFTQSAPSSPPSTPSGARPSSPSPSSSQQTPQDHNIDISPSPSPLCSPSTPSAALPEHAHHTSPMQPGPVLESPPLDTRPFNPHVLGLGLGIASPRPIHGPLSPFHSQLGAHRSSPVLTQQYPSDVPVQNINPASHTAYNATPSSSLSSSSTSPTPTLPSSLPSVGSPPPALPPPVSGTSHHPFEHLKLTSMERAATRKVSPLPSPSSNSAASSDAPPPSFAQAQRSPRAECSASIHQPEPCASSSSSSLTAGSLPGGQSHPPTGLRISMPMSSGNLSSPIVRSPLGQGDCVGAASLLPSPDIIQGHGSSPTGNANPFSFQPPGLDFDDELCAMETGVNAHDEHSPRNPFYHPSDSAAGTPDQHYAITADPAAIPAVSMSPFSDTHTGSSLTNPAVQFDDVTEFDTEGYSTLEKIYLFCRSRVTFHRVFIAKSLGLFLRGDGGSGSSGGSQEASQEAEEQIDTISPLDAVEYVLPLLNGLAMDEDEAVKEALASELVPIIWWFITRCKVVDEELPLDECIQAAEAEPISRDSVDGSAGAQDVSSFERQDFPSPAEARRSDSQLAPSNGHPSSESLHRSSSSPDPGMRHHNPLTALVHPHSSPSDSHASAPSLSPLPPPQTHTPDRPSPLGQSVFINDLEVGDAMDGPALISVQSFTPILGTLLLSPNTHIGGPARYAVVELLRRVRKADDYEHHTATQLPADPVIHPLDEEDDEARYSDIGTFREEQRRLFEREMIHQVVIGMGKLDSDASEELNAIEQTGGSGLSTATGTPFAGNQTHHVMHRSSPGIDGSYFPPVSPPSSEYQSEPHYGGHRLSPSILYPNSSTSSRSIPMPPPVNPFAGFAASGLLSPPLEMTPPISLSGSPFGTSNGSSSVVFPMSAPLTASSMSTPSLVSESSFAIVPPPSINSRTPPASEAPSSKSSLLGPFNLNSGSQSSDYIAGTSATATWVPPRSPGDLPFGSEEEQQQLGVALDSSDNGIGNHVTNWTVEENSEEPDLTEEAAVGRLSSMSLMAAVTASVAMSDEHQAAFVTEVERIGRDTVYWVRREASFVVGALAKVVPTEVVILSLLPLFETLCHDAEWQVRHSALFALPAILSRLTPSEKRHLALEVMLPLSKDESATVRSGVLEALAEVMYTFHEDPAGPPEELTRLFLGIREGETERRPKVEPTASMSWSEFMMMAASGVQADDSYDIYDDLTRPLVCAFNFPAVTLTLGRERWPELRELYLELSLNSSLKVRKTLAASLGEMAKIVGSEHAKQDMMGVWWGSVRASEGEVRLKAIECLAVFVRALAEQEQQAVVGGLVGEVWHAKLKGWREREGVISAVGELVPVVEMEEVAVRSLVMKGLRDTVAAVREATVFLVTKLVETWPADSPAVHNLLTDVNGLAVSSSYRERMTYIACQQDIFLAGLHGAVLVREPFWLTLWALVQDTIVDVRIKVARFLGVIFDRLVGAFEHLTPQLLEIVRTLSADVSVEVKAFCQPILDGLHALSPSDLGHTTTKAAKDAHHFSRPPLSVYSPG